MQATSSNEPDSNSCLHLLPCSIDYAGPAPVKKYFMPIDNKGELSAHFRGRKLIGAKRQLDAESNYTFVHALIHDKSSTKRRKVEVQSVYKDITVWNHHSQPNLQFMDDITDWLEIASAVRVISFFLYSNVCLMFVYSSCTVWSEEY